MRVDKATNETVLFLLHPACSFLFNTTLWSFPSKAQSFTSSSISTVNKASLHELPVPQFLSKQQLSDVNREDVVPVDQSEPRFAMW
jgi:hypothetical protein